ncbi:peptidoglycan DD-metalloendopeptidase family protein [Roseivirga echinicomitans]
MIGIVGLYDVKGGLIDESYYNGKPVSTASENGRLPKAPRSYIPDPDNECYITLIFWEIPYYITATGQIIQGSYRVTLQHQMEVECEGGGTGDQGIQDIYTNVNYTNPLPCPGDPLFAPELAATARGGTLGLNGARDGLTRHYDYETETFNLPEHDGTDIKAAVGSSLYAMYGGTVTQIERNSPTGFQDKSWGNYIEIESIVNGETIKLKYNHLQSVTSSLSVNDNVNQGDLIGKTGRTGNAWNVPNPHVHIQARELDGSTWKHRNPEDYMTTKFGTDHQPTNSNPCNN